MENREELWVCLAVKCVITVLAATVTTLPDSATSMSSFTLYGWAVCSWALINAFQVAFYL